MFLKTKLSRSFACRQNCALMCCRLTALAWVSLVTLCCFLKEKLEVRERDSQSKESVAPGCFSGVWGSGTLFTWVWCPHGMIPCYFRAEWGSPSEVPFPLGMSWSSGLLVSQVFWCTPSPGCRGWRARSWVWEAPGYHISWEFSQFLLPGGHAWVVPFQEVLGVPSLSWVWHTPVLMNLTLTYPLGITARAGQSEAT